MYNYFKHVSNDMLLHQIIETTTHVFLYLLIDMTTCN